MRNSTGFKSESQAQIYGGIRVDQFPIIGVEKADFYVGGVRGDADLLPPQARSISRALA